MIGLIGVFLVIAALDVVLDWVLIRSNIPIRHAEETFAAAVIYLATACFAVLEGLVSLEDALRVCFVLPSFRWIFHDLVLNVLRGLPLFYIGQAAQTDRFLRRFGLDSPARQFGLKMAVVVGSVLGAWLV